ncbi:MAG TPA: glycosyltransferase [Bryobacteraceae bacterium]|nr:glycosyltransferase [Bryobacteraceae bacterium]
MSTPLVSIVILNYKRMTALEQALQSVVAQQYPSKEVIVVDNHSEENVAAVVEKYGPGVRLIELEANLGACGGRNAGIRAARGEIVITLDNDVSFVAPDAIDKVVRVFEQQPGYHVLAFQLRDSHTGKLRIREWCHPKDWRHFAEERFPTHFFVEGAAAYRREVFDHAGLYFEPLFVYHEGWDLGLRILDKGYRILYTPEIQVYHLMSLEGRASSRPDFLFTRNYIWVAYRDYPLWSGLRFVSFRLAMMAYFALRRGHVSTFLEGLWAGIRGCRNIERAPVRRKTIQYVKSLESERPNIFVRYARHRTAPQL